MARDKEKRSCGQMLAEWRAFVWDPRSRQFLGRTGTSWGLILLFYLVFYGFLAGLFALTMWVLLQSVDPHVPKYQDRLATPGMMIRPRAEGLDVTFNVTQSQTWRHYVHALHQFLERECTGRHWEGASAPPGLPPTPELYDSIPPRGGAKGLDAANEIAAGQLGTAGGAGGGAKGRDSTNGSAAAQSDGGDGAARIR
ncbi:sodium/potassium-transporting ATPase subunit beta-2-like [Grus americana]|uniref:sodium/potassium-transporting ATPase subunit beta-2-like n=1 Tax=Grus americana TaxID=9117 RepID=UPI002407DB96|nr:sodium/potassium-transporting ATPase subunit beta-2-like [Grus americana]